MNKIQLKILGIPSGNLSSSYTLLLEEVNGDRKLPVVIGVLEAQAIAIEIEKIEPIRPLTHDLFKTLCQSFNLRVKEVIIHKLHEGIFYACLIVADDEGNKQIDSRTSDAIAIALRFNCPIYTYEEILEDAGIKIKTSDIKDIGDEIPEDTSEEEEEDLEEGLEDEFIENEPKEKAEEKIDIAKLELQPLSKLRQFLDRSIREEDYILAAKIRDVIKRKEEKKE
jgi:uncharacterized protein